VFPTLLHRIFNTDADGVGRGAVFFSQPPEFNVSRRPRALGYRFSLHMSRVR